MKILLFIFAITSVAQSNLTSAESRPSDPRWLACKTSADCKLVRIGTGCAWDAANKNHVEEYRKWDGELNKNKGAGPACTKNLNVPESKMKAVCFHGQCRSEVAK